MKKFLIFNFSFLISLLLFCISACEAQQRKRPMDRVAELVEMAHKAGLIVIVNIHHDGYGAKDTPSAGYHWLDLPAAAKDEELNQRIKQELTMVWLQIGQRFKYAGEWLVFETLNEIQDGGWGGGANRTDGGAQYRVLNEWNEVCVNAIRAAGGENETRYIGVPGYVCNPDLTVENLVHASAATEERPEGTVISSPGGWYDAGDYNKYIVNSGYTMGVWLMAYEMNKAYFDTLHLNIPESIVNRQSSNRQCPDMLAEAMYNIRWMMTMQDTDGGVYHKLTTPNFEKFIRPDQCKQQRYVVLKTTAATLDFAATMALAARVYAPFDPDFCNQAKEAAIRAFAWAQDNPEVYYDQPALNANANANAYAPAINTGAYDDFDVTDEFYWAATELYLLTHEEKWLNEINKWYMVNDPMVNAYTPAVWGNVAELADLDLLMHKGKSPISNLQSPILTHLQPYLDEAQSVSVHRSSYGNREEDFFWGCNSEGCCWRGIECLYAFHFTGDDRYFAGAQACLNYILGQNSTGYCFVTGFGSKPSSHPHHRLSYSHPKGTHPGFLVGGPNRMRQDAETDGVKYPKNVSADESYLDYQPSYATNEVTINWNVTLFALTAGLDACTDAPSCR